MRLTDPPDIDEVRALSALIVESRTATLGQSAKLTDSSGRLLGPFSCLLHSPVVGTAIQRIGLLLRTESSLPASASEAAILAIARSWHADYEWYAHERVARSEGVLSVRDIELIGSGMTPEAADASVAVNICNSLLNERSISPELYQDGSSSFGQKGLVELIMLIGYYNQLAMMIVAFETPAPSGAHYPWKAAEHATGLSASLTVDVDQDLPQAET
jgi:4-carboxymuconolactone decarboxylase